MALGKFANRIVGSGEESLDQIQFNPRNWRVHPLNQQNALKGVLEEVGWVQEVIVNKRTGNLVDGHLRCQLAAREGAKTIPVKYVDLSEEEEGLILSTLDPIAAMAATDKAKLDELFAGIETENADVLKMLDDIAEKERLEYAKRDPVDAEPQIDRAAELNEKWQVVTGDLWQIGEHKLLCGDSTKREDVERVMAGEKAVCMITDPPYGVNLDQSWRDEAVGEKSLGPGNKNLVANDSRVDWSDAWELFNGDIAYVWHADLFSDVVMASLRSVNLEVCQQIIWNKSIMVMGRNDYHYKHEPCWYAIRKGKNHSWTGDRQQTTVIDAKSPNHIMSGSKEVKTEHPTQKPIDCFMMIGNHGVVGDLVYDPFIGSGTTMVACQNLNRKCRAIEISPNYCAVILERMATAFPELEIKRLA